MLGEHMQLPVANKHAKRHPSSVPRSPAKIDMASSCSFHTCHFVTTCHFRTNAVNQSSPVIYLALMAGQGIVAIVTVQAGL